MNLNENVNHVVLKFTICKSTWIGWLIFIAPILIFDILYNEYIWSLQRFQGNIGVSNRSPFLSFCLIHALMAYFLYFNIKMFYLKREILRIAGDRVIFEGSDLGRIRDFDFENPEWVGLFSNFLKVPGMGRKDVRISSKFVKGSKDEILRAVQMVAKLDGTAGIERTVTG